MYAQFGSVPTQLSFDFAACSSKADPIEISYSAVQSGLYYALVVAGEQATATVTLTGQQ